MIFDQGQQCAVGAGEQSHLLDAEESKISSGKPWLAWDVPQCMGRRPDHCCFSLVIDWPMEVDKSRRRHGNVGKKRWQWKAPVNITVVFFFFLSSFSSFKSVVFASQLQEY